MILFGRSGGYWLFWVSAIYLALGAYFVYNKNVPDWSGAFYITALGLPFVIPPLGRWLNMDVNWDRNMFNLFGKKTENSNVVKFPDHRDYGVEDNKALPLPEKKEEPAKIFYRLGLTDNNRVAFSMGYSEITMNKEGCQQMIDQLKFFQRQLHDEGPSGGGGPDGGEPVPLPEEDVEAKAKKAA